MTTARATDAAAFCREAENSIETIFKSPELVAAIAVAAHRRWIELAEERLTTTRDAYIAGIQSPEIQGGTIILTLRSTEQNPIPMMVEEGMPAYDMREKILKGATSKVVRFKHADMNSATGPQQPFGHPLRKTRGIIGSRMIGRTIAREAQKLQHGEKLSAGHSPKILERHFTDPYSGMSHSFRGFSTFRTISLNSPSDAWQHPGIKAAFLLDQVVADMDTIMYDVVEEVMARRSGA